MPGTTTEKLTGPCTLGWNSVEHLGEFFRELIESPSSQHCLVIIDRDRMFMSGGHGPPWDAGGGFRKEAFMYDSAVNSWESIRVAIQ